MIDHSLPTDVNTDRSIWDFVQKSVGNSSRQYFGDCTYVSRRAATNRVISSEEELIALLAASFCAPLALKVVQLERLSFHEQVLIGIFWNASTLILQKRGGDGEHGICTPKHNIVLHTSMAQEIRRRQWLHCRMR